MAKKSAKLAPGSPIRVNAGVAMPEHPEVDISGWTGAVVEVQGRGATLKYIVEWDATALAAMPESYRQQCEVAGLFYGMACLPAADLGAADAES